MFLKSKISKVKGGKVGMHNMLYKKMMGKGTPAVKKMDENELKEFDNNLKMQLGQGVKKQINKSIKPLQFKL